MSNRRRSYSCKTRTLAVLSLIVVASVAGTLVAADGTVDTTFSTNLGTGFNSSVLALAVQGDQRIVVGGNFTTLNGVSSGHIGRLNANGSPNTAFSTNLGTGFDDGVAALAVQPDGKIIAGGHFTTLNGVTSAYIARLNGNGTPDTAFSSNLGTGFNGAVNAIAVQPDDKIVVGGAFSNVNGVSTAFISRLNTNGTLDMAFTTNLGTGFNSSVYSLAVQPDGKIVAGGLFTTLNGVTSNRVARLNADGTPDTAFTTNTGTGMNGAVNELALQGDGKTVLGGAFTTLNGVASNYIARLNADGTPDTTFSTNIGTGFNFSLDAVALQGDGKIVAAGQFTSLNGAVSNRAARLNSDGAPDTTFTANLGTGFNNLVFSIATQGDGKILVGGLFTTVNGIASTYVARLDAPVLAAGAPDTTFTSNVGTGFNGSVRSVAVQPDGKIVAGGDFTTLNGGGSNRLARLNADGTPDLTFSTNLGTGFDDGVWSVALQGDGKIVLGGAFTTVNGVSSKRVARLNADGTRDTTFTTNLGTGFEFFQVRSVAVQGNGKIVAGGDFTQVNGVAVNRVARLNADGTVDAAFNTNLGTGFNGGVTSVAVQGDGRILVGGSFTSVNGVTSNRLARLNASGTVDATFTTNLGTGFDAMVGSVVALGDGEIVAGGDFTAVNGISTNRLARLNQNGAPDSAFSSNLGAGFNGSVFSLADQGDGRIVVGGAFTSVNGVTSNRMARVSAVGEAGAIFATNLGSGFNDSVLSMAVQGDRKIVAGGSFTTLNGVTNNYIARLGVVLAFTNDPLQTGITTVKAVHITELRQRIGDLRARYGLPVFTWTDPTISTGVTSVKAAHVAELRSALHDVHVAAGRTPPTYTNATITPASTVITAVHLAEIRSTIAALW